MAQLFCEKKTMRHRTLEFAAVSKKTPTNIYVRKNTSNGFCSPVKDGALYKGNHNKITSSEANASNGQLEMLDELTIHDRLRNFLY